MDNIDNNEIKFEEYKLDRFTFYKSQQKVVIDGKASAYSVLVKHNDYGCAVASIGLYSLSPMKLSTMIINFPLTLPDIDLLLSETNIFIMEWVGRN